MPSQSSFHILLENILRDFVLQFYGFKYVNIWRGFLNWSFHLHEFSVFTYLILKYLSMESFILVSQRERDRLLIRDRFTMKGIRCL